MQKLRLGLLVDIARNARPSVGETLKLLMRQHKSRPPFSYGPSRRIAQALWSGKLSNTAAELAVSNARGLNDLGKRCNLEAVSLLHEQAKPYGGICRKIQPQPYQISRDAFIPVPIDFYFIDSGVPQLFLLQPRRTHAPDDRALGLLAGLIHDVYVPNVFEEAELFLLDLQARDGNRVPRRLRFRDLPCISEEELRLLLSVYLEAHKLFMDWAAEQPKDQREKPRPEDRDQFKLSLD